MYLNGNQVALQLVSNDGKQKPQTMTIRVVTTEASDVKTAEDDNSIGNNNTDNNINNNNNNTDGNSTNKKQQNMGNYKSDDKDYKSDADDNLSPPAVNKCNCNNNNNNMKNNDSRNPSRLHSRKNSSNNTWGNLGAQIKRQKRIGGMNILDSARK